MAQGSGSGANSVPPNKEKCSKAYTAKLELSQIIMTLFKNFVVLGSMLLILQIHSGDKFGLQAILKDGKMLTSKISFLIILTLMLTFLSIIDRYIYNNLMLGIGLGMGVVIIVLMHPNLGVKAKEMVEEVAGDTVNVAAAATANVPTA